jgi:hypothetical protein
VRPRPPPRPPPSILPELEALGSTRNPVTTVLTSLVLVFVFFSFPPPMTRKSSVTASLGLTLAKAFSTCRSWTGAKSADSASCCFLRSRYSSYDSVVSSGGADVVSSTSSSSSSSAAAASSSGSSFSETSAGAGSAVPSFSSTLPAACRASFLSLPQFRAPPPPFLISFPRPVPLRRSYARFPSRGGARPPRPNLVLRSLLV